MDAGPDAPRTDGSARDAGDGSTPDAATGPPRVLVFSATAGFRHTSIAAGQTAMTELGEAGGFEVDLTEDAADFTDSGLAPYAAVVWLNTTGDVLAADEEAAFERYVRAGGGYVGVHAATDTEYGWPFYVALVGASFARHPAIQEASVLVRDGDDPSTRHLSDPWVRTDEWYDFIADPRPAVHVLLAVDEATYRGGGMGADHPIAWRHEIFGGRAFYTAMGHTEESYAEPDFRAHLAGGIAWVLARPTPTEVLREFDGLTDPGTWARMQPRSAEFTYAVDRDGLEMFDSTPDNQHVVRRGLSLDPTRPTLIEVDFTIFGPLAGLSSFAINFNQGGPDDDLGPVDSMAINVDLGGSEPGGVMKYMGFVDGGFRSIGERSVAWGAPDTEYRIRVEINRNLRGETVPSMVTVTVLEGVEVLERFEQDYASFPYQPPAGEPVRFGLNTHGAHWRVRDLHIAYVD